MAACDGTIVEIEVYDGQPMVQKDDAVAQGMLLVSGVVDSKAWPDPQALRARIIAETQHDIIIRIPLEEAKLVPNGRIISRPVFGSSVCRFRCIPTGRSKASSSRNLRTIP